MRGVNVVCRLPSQWLGQTDVGREMDIEYEMRLARISRMTRRNTLYTHPPVLTDCVEIQMADG